MVEDTINYLWDRSAYPGTSLDDVYPRPLPVDIPAEISFAAKNGKTQSSSYSGYYAGAAAATLAFSSIAAYNMGRVNTSKASPETLL